MLSTFARHVRQQAVGYLALGVALGGVSYAVTVPRNSVGSPQIRNGQVKRGDLGANAVTRAKVRNGSLRSADFRTGDLPVGPAGPA